MQLRDRDGEIVRLRDRKARLSTKMVGETLEQHCEIEFNRIRAAAFQRAHFEKDNDARTGSKGDYIFRDSDELGAEIVSIMFEMKNVRGDNSSQPVLHSLHHFLRCTAPETRMGKVCHLAG